eukprot:scaffold16595_cov232-Amphora_coffeaeformis.AAC.10
MVRPTTFGRQINQWFDQVAFLPQRWHAGGKNNITRRALYTSSSHQTIQFHVISRVRVFYALVHQSVVYTHEIRPPAISAAEDLPVRMEYVAQYVARPPRRYSKME